MDKDSEDSSELVKMLEGNTDKKVAFFQGDKEKSAFDKLMEKWQSRERGEEGKGGDGGERK